MKSLLNEILNSSQFLEGAAWERKKYHANDIVVREGELGDSLFFIEQGELRVTGRVDLGKNKHIQPGIGDLKAGALFGESCLHKSLPRIATVTAITEVCLIVINGERLSIHLDANPVQGYLFYKCLFEILLGRLNSANNTVETILAWGLKAHEIEQHL